MTNCEGRVCMCSMCIIHACANMCISNIDVWISHINLLWLLHLGPLTSRQIFRFSEEGLVNARFDYSYNNFRVTSMQAVINETPLPIDLYRYVDVSGRVEQFGKFSVIFYDLNQVILTKIWIKSTKNYYLDLFLRSKCSRVYQLIVLVHTVFSTNRPLFSLENSD